MESGDLFLVLLSCLRRAWPAALPPAQELLALRLEFIATEALELEFVLQFIRQLLEFGFALLDALLDSGDGFFLRLQRLQFLLRRCARAVP